MSPKRQREVVLPLADASGSHVFMKNAMDDVRRLHEATSKLYKHGSIHG